MVLVLAVVLDSGNVKSHSGKYEEKCYEQDGIVAACESGVDGKEYDARRNGAWANMFGVLSNHAGKITTNNLVNRKKLRTFAPHFERMTLKF